MANSTQQVRVNNKILTDKQIRDVVTPYEFGVSDHLIGTALARPLRRGVALLIDLFLVVMLTELPSILLAALCVVFFWRAGKRKETPRFAWLRKLMKVIAAIILFGVLTALFTGVNEFNSGGGFDDDDSEKILTGTQGIELAATMLAMTAQMDDLQDDISQQRCTPYDCWDKYVAQFTSDIEDTYIPPDLANEMAGKLRDRMQETLTAEQADTLIAQLKAAAEKGYNSKKIKEETGTAPAADEQDKDWLSVPRNDEGDPSLLAWVRGLLEDLGIGFGWAALYFTALTYWMHGQTPGKKLLGIKVIKLDGSTMTLWESFERYGGYGAGIATGLLGFLQIFWEPNRQAIHDKISETLVIHLGLNKVDVRAVMASNAEDAADAPDYKV
ncbi:RDD family protein [Alteromonas sp. CYL-A6]|uniref:RDD family protein n=1 Tax=Alteromonas nitratireducens TaxID=3390813 RepID=UPI0034B19442